MKSLTLHNIDDPLLSLVKEKAKAQNMSINQFLKDLIEKTLGYKKTKKARYFDEFKDVCGVWSPEQLQEFESNTKDFECIDPEDWR
ncbi:MAG: hypothetical protein JXI43_09890 [Tissierellales bacterium]|nr:hypothetical protein [Tissierellales bacterium]